MAETKSSLQQTHQPSPTLESLFTALDPISLILSLNSNSNQINTLKLTTESFIMERGPRYRAYAELRESKLRMKSINQQQQNPQKFEKPESKLLTPPKKQVKFQGNFPPATAGRKGSSVLAQSVPDFSVVLRKENRKPATTLPSMLEMTPPSKNHSRVNGEVLKLRGSKSANAGEKKGGGGWVTRKSYASVEELKGFSSAAATAIHGENRGGRTVRGVGKTVLGYRQF